jgi:hypothetical protein
MIDLLAGKCVTGDISVNMAQQLMSKQEWGLAKRAVEQALEKGGLSNPASAQRLLEDISQRLDGFVTRPGSTDE